MARTANVVISTQTWIQLTNADADAVRVQNIGGLTLYLQATADTTPPDGQAGISGSILLQPMETLTAGVLLADLFPGVTGAARLWALCGAEGNASVSHADA